MKQIHIFRTDISGKDDLEKIAPLFEQDDRVQFWSVDLHDRDKVLRVMSDELAAAELQKITTDAGFFCEELTA